MSHFPLNYPGNKYKEFKHYENAINLEGKKYIVEPFGGTLAMSFQLWKKNKDLIYVVNDINPMMTEVYEILKNETTTYIEEQINERLKNVMTKETWDNNFKLSKTDPYYYIIYNKYYSYRPGVFPLNKKINPYKFTKLQLEFVDFIKSDNTIVNNKDWEELFNEYKDREDALFLMDPPYLISDNSHYNMGDGETQNVYEYFAINDKVKFPASIYFILEMNWIIKLLFRGKKVFEYNKTYELTKKKVIHGCIEI